MKRPPSAAAVAWPASTSVSAMTTFAPFLDEALGDALADAAGGADDQRDLAFQSSRSCEPLADLES